MKLTNEQIDGAIHTFKHMIGMDLEGHYVAKFELDIAIKALKMAKSDGWQPIETAPKDGTKVILRFKTDEGKIEVLDGWFRQDGTEYKNKWERISSSADSYSYFSFGKITHWMPLPDTPKEGE
tara:strand:- start:17863 stop:18231 length:369 start_codon:yes stop_codon:yes gene_type:complete